MLLSTEQLEYSRLLVTELVTNSVLHAKSGPRDDIRVWTAVRESALYVEVSDLGPGFERPAFEGLRAGAATAKLSARERPGRGLYLLERLTDRWGVIVDGITQVWFEIQHG